MQNGGDGFYKYNFIPHHNLMGNFEKIATEQNFMRLIIDLDTTGA